MIHKLDISFRGINELNASTAPVFVCFKYAFNDGSAFFIPLDKGEEQTNYYFVVKNTIGADEKTVLG